MTSSHIYDIAIIGAGPAGLALSCSLAGTGLRVCLIEKHPRTVLEFPPEDGRDIALTHASINVMRTLGILEYLPQDALSPINEARVLNGTSSYFLNFDRGGAGEDALGYLLSNHLIRRASYRAAVKTPTEIMTGIEVTSTETSPSGATLKLSDGRALQAALVVAADSRFSKSREQMGVDTSITEFGKACIVCHMEHEKRHYNIAYECFHYDNRTLAVLPLVGNMSSIVITLPLDKADEVMQMTPEVFSKDIENRFESRLGVMKLVGQRHKYPLVAIYAKQFFAQRYALIGDAAIGMHPVTAHGYNLGLRAQHLLAESIKAGLKTGSDIGSSAVLERFDKELRHASRTLYLGTNALVKLYTSDKRPARILRDALLRLGNNLPPFKRIITNQLTELKYY